MTGFELTCTECQDILDVYVEAEVAGQDVRHLFPPIWRHVQTCPVCGTRYEALLHETRSSQSFHRSAGIAVSTRRLSFLPPTSPASPWVAQWRSGLTGAPFGVSYTIDPQYLRQRLLGSSTLVTRRTDDTLAAEPKILVRDFQSIGEQTLAVLVTGTLALNQPGVLTVHASIASSEPLPKKLWATLTWADFREARPVDASGVVDFSPVSLDALLQPNDEPAVIALGFEVREAGPPI